MFQFFPKRLPIGPWQFTHEVVIERPVEAVYELLDFASPRNAYLVRGDKVAPSDGLPGSHELTLQAMPDMTHYITVHEAEEPFSYTISSRSEPVAGRLAVSHEAYDLKPLNADACRVSLIHSVIFTQALSAEAFALEELRMHVANHNGLAKLKLQAERGVDAVKATAGRLIV